jgi:malto-oligosyltrehalose trehalohydrolase
VDAAHERGLMVILDVVYNHFGPEGNYLSLYAPQFFNARHQTPWGAAINFDADGAHTVREFFIHNALYWLEEFHLDGLRLDAVHALVDDSPLHILEQLAQRVRSAELPRSAHLIVENEHNQARWLRRERDGNSPLIRRPMERRRASRAARGRQRGIRGLLRRLPGSAERLGRALAQGFAFQGELMPYRGSARGEASAHLPPTAFVAFLQNHDQVGNRAFGERLNALADPAALRAVTALYLLLPQIPMLFMGEEWHSRSPFQFFCDFGGKLGDAVRDGRRQEFAHFAAFRDVRGGATAFPTRRQYRPSRTASSTGSGSPSPSHAATLRWYRDLLAVRRRHIVPLLPRLGEAGEYSIIDDGALVVRWRAADGAQLTLMANLSARTTPGFPAGQGRLLWQQGKVDAAGTFAPWSLRWTLNA